MFFLRYATLKQKMYCYLIHYCRRWLELILQCLTLHPGDYRCRGCCLHVFFMVVTVLARPKYSSRSVTDALQGCLLGEPYIANTLRMVAGNGRCS